MPREPKHLHFKLIIICKRCRKYNSTPSDWTESWLCMLCWKSISVVPHVLYRLKVRGHCTPKPPGAPSIEVGRQQLVLSCWWEPIDMHQTTSSEAKASVPGIGISNKLGEWLSIRFSLRVSSAMGGHDRNEIWHKGRIGGDDDVRTQRAIGPTTFNDEKFNWPRTVRIDRTCVVVTALCNRSRWRVTLLVW